MRGQSSWRVSHKSGAERRSGGSDVHTDVAWRRLEHVSHTLFVDNLPHSMSRDWLWQLFHHEGKVVDVYVSWKKRKATSTPFAFVRFAHLADAQKAIQNMNGLEIRGMKLEVSMAEHKRCETIPSAGARTDNGRAISGANQFTRNLFSQKRSYKEILIQNGAQNGAHNE